MNGITINNKQYIFVISDEHCDGCVLDRRSCEIICNAVCSVAFGPDNIYMGLFKELKEEK